MRNLVQCRLPTEETAKAVRALYDDSLLSRFCIMGVGIIARKFQEEGKVEAAEENVTWLLELLKNTKTGSVRRDILRGIANSAHPMVFDEMKRLIAEGGINERAGAVEAIRLLKFQEVDRIIAQHLNFNQEPAFLLHADRVQTMQQQVMIKIVNRLVILHFLSGNLYDSFISCA